MLGLAYYSYVGFSMAIDIEDEAKDQDPNGSESCFWGGMAGGKFDWFCSIQANNLTTTKPTGFKGLKFRI